MTDQVKKEAGYMEEKSIFREKSIERVTSPEQLNDYIKVTTPSVWLILFATLILIVGTLFWAVFGKIQVNTDSESLRLRFQIKYSQAFAVVVKYN